MKKKVLFTPCSSSDIEKIESWLQDLSAEGLILCKGSLHSLYGVFEITEPQICRYRLQPSANADRIIKSDDDPDEKLIHICEENNWHCVSKFGRFLVFRCSDPGAAELNTDPIVQAASLERGMTAGTMMLILYMILFAVNIHNVQGSYNQMFY